MLEPDGEEYPGAHAGVLGLTDQRGMAGRLASPLLLSSCCARVLPTLFVIVLLCTCSIRRLLSNSNMNFVSRCVDSMLICVENCVPAMVI